jgi:hypothetical protein
MTMTALLFLIPALLSLFAVRITMGFQLGSPLPSSQSILARTSSRATAIATSHLWAVGPLVLDQEQQELHSQTIHHHHRGHGKIVEIRSKEQYSSFLAEDDRLCIIK